MSGKTLGVHWTRSSGAPAGLSAKACDGYWPKFPGAPSWFQIRASCMSGGYWERFSGASGDFCKIYLTFFQTCMGIISQNTWRLKRILQQNNCFYYILSFSCPVEDVRENVMERERDAQTIVIVSTNIQKLYSLTSSEGSNNNKSDTQKSSMGYGNSKKETPAKKGMNTLPLIFKNTHNTMLRERGKGARWEVHTFVVQRLYSNLILEEVQHQYLATTGMKWEAQNTCV